MCSFQWTLFSGGRSLIFIPAKCPEKERRSFWAKTCTGMGGSVEFHRILKSLEIQKKFELQWGKSLTFGEILAVAVRKHPREPRRSLWDVTVPSCGPAKNETRVKPGKPLGWNKGSFIGKRRAVHTSKAKQGINSLLARARPSPGE